MQLSTDDKRTWCDDTFYYLSKDDKSFYIDQFDLDKRTISDLNENEVNDLFDWMVSNDDIDLSDWYNPIDW